LVLSGNTLYGTASAGGTSGNGTVFAVNTEGSVFSTLYSFSETNDVGINSDGAYPWDGLILSGNTLYGTAEYGGSYGDGTVFAVSTGGTDFTNLYSFTGSSNNGLPFGGLILSGNTLFGTTTGPGTTSGTVFAVNTEGSGFTTLHSFSAVSCSPPCDTPPYPNSDGAFPWDGVILSGNTLYGTANSGGSSGWGTVFAVNTNGTGFTTLYNFTGGSDGADPCAGLILSGNILYGTAAGGGSSGSGTVFAVNTNGTGFTTLYNFSDGSDGANPDGGLILSGNILYGTASRGDSSGSGTVFSVTLPAPPLSITASDTNIIMTWPTNAAGISFAGYTLQCTTNLVSPAVWTPVSPGPVVVNGQFTVTNPLSGPQQFYQLSQ
jgi:uncharacterized repeat protein (TIGR03803 family)